MILENDSLTFWCAGTSVTVPVKDVSHIKGHKDYVLVYYKNQNCSSCVVHSTMKNVEEILADNNFLRCHKSFIVNLLQISNMKNTNFIFLFGAIAIPFGREYKKEFKKAYTIFKSLP